MDKVAIQYVCGNCGLNDPQDYHVPMRIAIKTAKAYTKAECGTSPLTAGFSSWLLASLAMDVRR